MSFRIPRSPFARTLDEERAVFTHLLRWTVLAVPVAIGVGSAVALFLWLLELALEVQAEVAWLLFLLPIAGIVIAASYHWFGRDSEGGNNLIIEELHTPTRRIPLRMAPLVLLGTVGTHLFGGSAGREGTAVQMGGGIAGGFNRIYRLEGADYRVLVLTGIGAGFGAVFGTPIAGAVFAMEVRSLCRVDYEAIVPVLVAAMIADATAVAWGAHHVHYSISALPAAAWGLPFDPELLGKAVFLGIAAGLASRLFSELTRILHRLFRTAISHPVFRPTLGGLIVIVLALVFGRDYLALGVESPNPDYVTIVSSFEEGGADPFSWLAKIIFTSVTLASGFKGGEVTPLFYIGATLGNAMGTLLRAPIDLFAGLGFVAVFAGAANTPIACIFMGIELFGGHVTPYLAVTCVVSYIVSGHTGIYLSQRVGMPKFVSSSVAAESTLSAVVDGKLPSSVLTDEIAAVDALEDPDGDAVGTDAQR